MDYNEDGSGGACVWSSAYVTCKCAASTQYVGQHGCVRGTRSSWHISRSPAAFSSRTSSLSLFLPDVPPLSLSISLSPPVHLSLALLCTDERHQRDALVHHHHSPYR